MKIQFVIVYFSFSVTICQQINQLQFENGSVDFPEVVQSGFYVDKSLMVETFFKDPNDVMLATAPRNFGKTLNVLLLKHYFEIEVDRNGDAVIDKTKTKNYNLFKKLKIFEKQSFFNATFGTLPIIYVDYGMLNDIVNYETMMTNVRQILSNTFEEHRYLMLVDNLWVGKLDIDDFKKYIDSELNKTLDEYDLKNGLNFLAKVLHRHFSRKAIVLFDEYDALVNSIVFGNATEVGSIFRLFHDINSDVIKYSSEFVHKVFATGTLRVASPGLAPADHDFKEFPFLHNHRYSDYYGMNEDELSELIEKYSTNEIEIDKLKEETKQNYDGYKRLADGKTLYRIASVVEYLDNKTFVIAESLTTFWVRPKWFTLFLRLFYRVKIRYYIIKLLQNETVSIAKNTILSVDDVLSLRDIIFAVFHQKIIASIFELFFKFLLQLGYLTYKQNISKQNLYVLEFPNLEIKKGMEHALIHSVVQEFAIPYSVIDELNNCIDNISKTKYKIEEFKNILSNYTRLSGIQKAGLPTNIDFHSTLLAIFRNKFHENVTSVSMENNGLTFIHLINTNDVSFIIESKVLKQLTQVTERLMLRFTKRLISNMTRYYTDKINVGRNLTNRAVYMSLCFGVTLYSKGEKPKNCFFSVGYSKDLKPSDALYGKTVLAQGPFYRHQRKIRTTRKPYRRPTRKLIYRSRRTKGTGVPHWKSTRVPYKKQKKRGFRLKTKFKKNKQRGKKWKQMKEIKKKKKEKKRSKKKVKKESKKSEVNTNRVDYEEQKQK